MKKWNFGIVGAGLIADFHARAIGDLPNTLLVGVCDKKSERAGALADKYSCKVFGDCQELLGAAEIDIVTIATPSGVHMEVALAAAEAKKHVI